MGMQAMFDNITTLIDVHAQVEMARWAKMMTVLTVISLAFSFGALVGIFASLGQTKRSIETTIETAAVARNLGEAQARAYVHVSSIKLNGDLEIIATIENSGATPSPTYFAGCEVKRVKDGQISRSIVLTNYAFKSWQALPANGSPTIKLSITRGEEILDEVFSQEGSVAAAKYIISGADDNVVVVGNVIYSDVFGNYYQTGFAFYSKPTRASFLKPTHLLPAFEPIPSSHVPQDVIEVQA
jgi:hypothetical protein